MSSEPEATTTLSKASPSEGAPHPEMIKAEVDDSKELETSWNEVVSQAVQGERNEKSIGLWSALKRYPKAATWSLAISTCLVMEGYDTAILGNLTALPIFRERYGSYINAKAGYQLAPAWQTAVGQGAGVGAFCGVLISAWFQTRFGYKRTIQGSLILITAFIAIVVTAPSIQVLFVGELLCRSLASGLPWGAFSTSAVAYASELAPVPLRAYLTTYVNLCWVMGQMVASGVVYACSHRTDQLAYKLPFALQWMWPLPLFILATLAPESPWYLVRMGRLAEAEKAVASLASRDTSEESHAQTVAMMVRTNKVELEDIAGTSYLDCFKGSNLRRTEISAVAWAITVWAGSAFANHPEYFFTQAGFTTSNSLQLGLGLRALAFFGQFVAWTLFTFYGRRRIFLTGLTIQFFLLLITGILAFPAMTNRAAAWGQAAMLFLWVLTWNSAVTTTAYAIVGETSSTRLRGKTVGLSRNFYTMSGILAGWLNTYQINPAAWGWSGEAGFFWAGTCLLSLIWAYFRLPELKGRSYREVDILFERKTPARRFTTATIDETADA